MPLRTLMAARTDVGRIRDRNEDRFLAEPDAAVAVVADGMGGHPGGDVASAVAADAAGATLRVWSGERRREGGADPSASLEGVAGRAVLDAHEAVRREGARRPELRGMGTTLTAFVLDPATGRWGVGHAGDSRAYRARDGAVERITRDDTWVQAQVEEGRLAPEDAWGHPGSHILQQCVGLETSPEPHVYTGEGRPGDRFLLCSDGLTDMIDEAALAPLLLDGEALEETVDALVDEALERGGRDNVTAVLVELVDG